MIFEEIKLKGAYRIELEQKQDERGFFARSFCQDEFRKHGIDFGIVQCNISFNKEKGTLRGMHYQIDPYEEAKLISCVRGAIYDVIIDLRKDSVTYCQWYASELTEEDYRMLYVPKGFAHGYQTLKINSVVSYQVSEFYHPGLEKGLRWNDPSIGIRWPLKPKIISNKDLKLLDFVK
ncbi:MAG: dTDP-4-dehydrorhamnose 3,5-epimerase [Candidatus Omnitrophica bacterium]|nr:dTDP-4-dehydrorhamnose 3,5-epimerase [Candidatus Omnitrophota bacterium]